jgi:hypothetical protein
MGIGAAVPIALLLFLVLDWIVSSGAKAKPVASAPGTTSAPASAPSHDSDDRNGASRPAERGSSNARRGTEPPSQNPPPPLFGRDSSGEDPFPPGPRYALPWAFIFVMFLLGVALSSVMFLVACNVIKETCEFPRAMAIVFVACLPNVIMLVTIGHAQTMGGSALLLLLNLAWLVVVTWIGLRTSPAKALAIGIVYFLITFLFFFSIAFVVGLVAGALAYFAHHPI